MVSLEADASKLRALLAGFSVEETTCYDPNEHAKVMEAIRVCGAQDFSVYIQSLATSGTVALPPSIAVPPKIEVEMTELRQGAQAQDDEGTAQLQGLDDEDDARRSSERTVFSGR